MAKKGGSTKSSTESATQKDLVLYLANLAHLPLSHELEQALTQTLPDILNFVEQIKSLSLTEVKKTYRTTEEENIMREDLVTPSISQSEALKNAPATSQGYFLVPRIIENE